MPRFRTESGSVVSVDDATAARIGGNWTPLDGPAEPTPEPAPVKRGPGRPKKAE